MTEYQIQKLFDKVHATFPNMKAHHIEAMPDGKMKLFFTVDYSAPEIGSRLCWTWLTHQNGKLYADDIHENFFSQNA